MPSLGNLNVEIGANLQPLEAGLNKAKSQLSDFGRTATTNLNGADASLKNLYQHLDNLTASLAKTRFGTAQFKELETEITKTTVRIEALEAAELGAAKAGQALASSNAQVSASTTPLAGGLSALGKGFSVVRQAAYLLPGIGIAGIFDVIFQGVTQAASGMGLFAEKTKEASKAVEQAVSDAAKEVISFRELASVAADDTQSKELRLAAVKKLRSEYGPYLQDLSNEQILSGQLGTAYEKVNAALLKKVALQAGEEKLLPIIKEQLNLQLKQMQNEKDIALGANISREEIDKANRLGIAGVQQLKAAASGAKREYDSNSAAIAELNKQIDKLFAGISKFAAGSAGLDLKVTQPVEKAIPKVKELRQELEKLSLFNLRGGAEAPTAPETKTPLVPLIGQGDATNNRVSKNLEKSKTELIAQATQAAGEIQKTFDNLISNVIGSFGESLGAALAGKQDPFQALKQTLSSGIKALGESLIRLGALALPIQKALKNLLTTPAGPFIVIGAGIALEALAGAITSKGVTPHAEGGVFTGPTQIGSHLFGEAGPEFLVGQNKLQQLLQETSGRNNHVTVDGNISLGYNEIKIALSRADRYRGRNYGPGNG